MNGRKQGFIVGVVAGGCLLAFSQAWADGSTLFPADNGPAHSWQQAAPWAPANPNGTPDHAYDMGPLGKWDISGGIDGYGAAWNNSADVPD